jgi:uncharacterized protein YdhG (YjbR/CyaY superfamily)
MGALYLVICYCKLCLITHSSMQTKSPQTISAYIAQFPQTTQDILEKIREMIKKIAPQANEAIKYAIPTFVHNGKNFVHFGGYAHHIGFYPTPAVLEHFQPELKQYKQAKGSVQFPLDQPIPYELIQRMVEYRLESLN